MTAKTQPTQADLDSAKVVSLFQSMNVRELRKAAQGKIKNASRLPKDSLILALIEHADTVRLQAELDSKVAQAKSEAAAKGSKAAAEAKTDKDGKPFKSTAKPKVNGTPVKNAKRAGDNTRKVATKGKCEVCNKRRVDKRTQGKDSTMCTVCFEYAGWENMHSDNDHDGKGRLNSASKELRAEMAECPVCQNADPADVQISHPKAAKFYNEARANGWDAKVIDHGTAKNKKQSFSVVVAKDGQEISLTWDAGAYDYNSSAHKTSDNKSRKVRNTSAALSILTAS